MKSYIALFVTALALTACAKKPAAPATSPGAGAPGSIPAASFAAETLGLDLVSASQNDPVVPGSDVFGGGLGALDPAYIKGEVILRNTLNVTTTTRGPFFTWPRGEGNKQIDVAFYAVRVQGTDNRLGGEPHYEVATYDRDARRFFIPLKDALSRRLQDLGPADDQILMIRLQFARGEVAEFTLRFRVAGPITALQVIKDEQLTPNIDGGFFMRAGSVVPMRRATFQNPTLRRLTYWLKPVRENLSFIGTFNYTHATGHGGDPSSQLLSWNAPMQMSQIAVIQGGQRRVGSYQGLGGAVGNWTPIHVGPGEQFAVEWLASSRGCGGTRGDIIGVSAQGSWEMDTWVTDDSRPTLPAEFQSIPSTLSLGTGPIGLSATVRTGTWDGGLGTRCQ